MEELSGMRTYAENETGSESKVLPVLNGVGETRRGKAKKKMKMKPGTERWRVTECSKVETSRLEYQGNDGGC